MPEDQEVDEQDEARPCDHEFVFPLHRMWVGYERCADCGKVFAP